jgi:hypothetical protein
MKGNFKKTPSIKQERKLKADKEYNDFKSNKKNRRLAISTMIFVAFILSAVIFAIYQSI